MLIRALVFVFRGLFVIAFFQHQSFAGSTGYTPVAPFPGHSALFLQDRLVAPPPDDGGVAATVSALVADSSGVYAVGTEYNYHEVPNWWPGFTGTMRAAETVTMRVERINNATGVVVWKRLFAEPTDLMKVNIYGATSCRQVVDVTSDATYLYVLSDATLSCMGQSPAQPNGLWIVNKLRKSDGSQVFEYRVVAPRWGNITDKAKEIAVDAGNIYFVSESVNNSFVVKLNINGTGAATVANPYRYASYSTFHAYDLALGAGGLILGGKQFNVGSPAPAGFTKVDLGNLTTVLDQGYSFPAWNPSGSGNYFRSITVDGANVYGFGNVRFGAGGGSSAGYIQKRSATSLGTIFWTLELGYTPDRYMNSFSGVRVGSYLYSITWRDNGYPTGPWTLDKITDSNGTRVVGGGWPKAFPEPMEIGFHIPPRITTNGTELFMSKEFYDQNLPYPEATPVWHVERLNPNTGTVIWTRQTRCTEPVCELDPTGLGI